MYEDLLVSPFSLTNAVKAVGNGDGTTTLSGIGAIYDEDAGMERDWEGDYFYKSTFFSPRLNRGDEDEFEATFHHGVALRPEYKALAAHEFANPVKSVSTDAGLLLSLILDERNEYEAVIAKAAREGALGWSLGSAGHRARKKAMGDGRNRIERWPIVEIAVTHKPVEPRTFAVPLKSLLHDPVGDALKAYREELEITNALRAFSYA